jgi:MCM AAA-lid domain
MRTGWLSGIDLRHACTTLRSTLVTLTAAMHCSFEQDEEEAGEQPRYLKQGLINSEDSADEGRMLTVPFLRKFLYYCKTKFAKQTLTQDAFEEISQFYVEVRQAAATGIVDPRFRCAAAGVCGDNLQFSKPLVYFHSAADRLISLPSCTRPVSRMCRASSCRPIPVTARLLETIIRLATAHSKVRFSRKIEKEDVDAARQLVLRIIDQSLSVEAEPDGDEDGSDAEDAPVLEPVPLAAGSRCVERTIASASAPHKAKPAAM